MIRTALVLTFAICGCTAPERQPGVADAEPGGPESSEVVANRTAAVSSSTSPEAYSEKLQWMLERTAFAEDPDVPCLLRDIERPAWVERPEVRTRLREVRSDSYWLGRWARDNLGDRLAYATVTYAWEPRAGQPFPAEAPPLVYRIAVTGSEQINPPPLGDRAEGVPVEVIYDVPYSFDEFMERRAIGRQTAAKLLDTNGEGGSPENGWAVRMDVYSEDGRPDPAALAYCDTLRRAYDLPILMEFSSARMTQGPADF